MERRIGSALIMIEDPDQVAALNLILSKHNRIIIGRQGIPLRDRDISIISIVMEGTTDEIGALAGQVGRLKGVQVKTILTR
jgi:putative iron-only hydrogenase system regulator